MPAIVPVVVIAAAGVSGSWGTRYARQVEEARLARIRSAPRTYPNPRGNDPFDNDAVEWLIRQPGGEVFTAGSLFQQLRRQPAELERSPEGVRRAESLAKRHGVEQRLEFDPRIGKSVVRMYRTDADAPDYSFRSGLAGPREELLPWVRSSVTEWFNRRQTDAPGSTEPQR